MSCGDKTPNNMTEISFHVNGVHHAVPGNLPATTSLNEYLREHAGLKGTKVMCREAGCGCCAVTVTHAPPDSNKMETYSVQSCVTPLYAVDGWQISTVEGIGSQKKGFHPIQEKIADFNGTQCGYCTPGMVMNMYGLLHQNPNITAQEVEDSFDGNICRCTGYRPILDAMKSFARDTNIPGGKPIDIEDLNKNLCPKTGEACSGTCKPRSLGLELDGVRWYRPVSLSDLGKLMKDNKGKRVRLVFGNTSTGIYKDDGPFDVFIDLHCVKELYSFEVSANSVRLGASTTLTQFLERLRANQERPGFKYFSQIHKHIKVVANVMVRNGGCIAGNLMIKYWHKEFPSDIFATLECVGASVEYADTKGKKATATLFDFMYKVDMSNKVLTAVILPSLAENVHFRSFKITPRWQNAHAYVNAAFKIPTNGPAIKGRPSIVIGGINAQTVHAVKTEDFLTNKTLSAACVKEACKILKGELVPHESPLESSPKYRKDLAGGLLYKVLLGLHTSRGGKLRSGPENLHRPISSGLQTYQEKTSEFPLKKGMPKKTAPLQASGEAQYVNDLPKFQQELFAAFVLSEVASADLASLDATEALKMPGVVRFLTAKDIPGGNNTTLSMALFPLPPHELFVSKEVSHAGQALGMILAETQAQATEAAKKVKANYSAVRPPILSEEESKAQGKEIEPIRLTKVNGDPEEAMKTAERTVEGVVKMGSQYHFFIETHIAVAVPSEDGIDLYAATQFSDMCQSAAAHVIGKPMNFVNVTVPRLGGSFGGKGVDPTLFSTAATLGAFLTDRPVRISLDLASTIKMCGKRPPITANYKAGFNSDGGLKVVDVEVHADVGYTSLGVMCIGDLLGQLDMGYHVDNWNVVMRSMYTNKRSAMPCRAPGTVPAALIIESILEHVAHALSKDPIMVKEINLIQNGQSDIMGHVMTNCNMKEVWRRLKDTAEVEGRRRQVEAFNQENAWKKRAISMSACRYGMHYFGDGQGATVSIFGRDGSVVISQGGVEMGQGLYTKVAQGVAYILGIPMDNIKVRPNMAIITPNNFGTGGSVTSEISMQSAIKAAEILRERMEPIKAKFPDLDWAGLCSKCVSMKVDLSARYLFAPEGGTPSNNYNTFCAAVTETEVDVITGESQVRRVDIMADYGESLNPVIDIGQTEGGYVMGLGAYLTEDTIFDKDGRILSDGTWNYKPPTTKDIPIDWRIHLLPDTPNPAGIRSSKATGEPSISLAVGALMSNKYAIQAARKDLLGKDDFIPVVAPFTVERAQQSLGLTEDIMAF